MCYGVRRCGRGTRWIPRAHRLRGTLRWRCGIGLRFHSHMPPCQHCESTRPRGRPPCEGCAQATKKVGISFCVEAYANLEFHPHHRRGGCALALNLFAAWRSNVDVGGQACTCKNPRQLKWRGKGRETCRYAHVYAYQNQVHMYTRAHMLFGLNTIMTGGRKENKSERKRKRERENAATEMNQNKTQSSHIMVESLA